MTRFDDILERLNARLTTSYYTEPDGNIDKLMRMQAKQVEYELNTIDDITSAHKMLEATGYSLDQWGTLLRVKRGTGEADTHYRTRLFAWSLIYRRSATLGDILDTLTSMLVNDPTTILFEEDFETTSAYFKTWVLLKDIVDAGYDVPDIETLVKQIKSVGANLELIPYGEIVSGQNMKMLAEYTFGFLKNIGAAEMVDSHSKVWDAKRIETESINVSDDDNYYHYTDVTYTDSLNIVA